MPASLDLTHIDPHAPNAEQHERAVLEPHGFERAIIDTLTGLAGYAQAYGNFAGHPIRWSPQGKYFQTSLECLRDLVAFGCVGRLHKGTLMRCIDRLLSSGRFGWKAFGKSSPDY